MSFVQHQWEDRVAEHGTRRTLTYVDDNTTETVDVEKAEGATYNTSTDNVAEFNAEIMNSIEARIKAGFDAIDAAMAETLDTFYPVGSVYISMSNTSPATLFGGTWQSLSGGVLLPSNNANASAQGSDTNGYYPTGSVGFTGSVDNGYAELPYHQHLMGTNQDAIIYSGSGDIKASANSNQYQYYIYNLSKQSDSKGGGQPHGHSFSGGGYLSGAGTNTINTRMAGTTVYAWRRTA